MAGTAWDSFSTMLDTFYETREQQERVRQKGQDLLRMGFWLRSRDAAACAELERAGRWYDPDRIEWEVRLRAL